MLASSSKPELKKEVAVVTNADDTAGSVAVSRPTRKRARPAEEVEEDTASKKIRIDSTSETESVLVPVSTTTIVKQDPVASSSSSSSSASSSSAASESLDLSLSLDDLKSPLPSTSASSTSSSSSSSSSLPSLSSGDTVVPASRVDSTFKLPVADGQGQTEAEEPENNEMTQTQDDLRFVFSAASQPAESKRPTVPTNSSSASASALASSQEDLALAFSQGQSILFVLFSRHTFPSCFIPLFLFSSHLITDFGGPSRHDSDSLLLESLKKDLTAQRALVETTRTKLAELERTHRETLSSLEKSKKEVSNLQHEIAGLRTDLTAKDSTISKLTLAVDANSTLQQTLEKTMQQRQELQEKLDRQLTQSHQLQQSIEKEKQSHSVLQTSLTKAQTDLSQLQALHDQLKQSHDAFKSNYEQLKDSQAKLEEDLKLANLQLAEEQKSRRLDEELRQQEKTKLLEEISAAHDEEIKHLESEIAQFVRHSLSFLLLFFLSFTLAFFSLPLFQSKTQTEMKTFYTDQVDKIRQHYKAS
jgi:hypothetical protein